MLSMDTQLNGFLGLDPAIIRVFLLWWKSNLCTVTAPIAWIFFPLPSLPINQSGKRSRSPASFSLQYWAKLSICGEKYAASKNVPTNKQYCARGTVPSVCVCVCTTCKVCCQIHSLHSDSDRQTLCGCDACTLAHGETEGARKRRNISSLLFSLWIILFKCHLVDSVETTLMPRFLFCFFAPR